MEDKIEINSGNHLEKEIKNLIYHSTVLENKKVATPFFKNMEFSRRKLKLFSSGPLQEVEINLLHNFIEKQKRNGFRKFPSKKSEI